MDVSQKEETATRSAKKRNLPTSQESEGISKYMTKKPKTKTTDERVVDDEYTDKPLKKVPVPNRKGMKRVLKERVYTDDKGY